LSLTFLQLKQYARDQLQDKNDTKAIRRAGRIANNALKMLTAEKTWSFHRIRHRILIQPRATVGGCTMASRSTTMTLDSGSLPSNASLASFYFSGDTEIMRIASANLSGAEMFSTDVYNASAAASNANGVLVYDRVRMPDNFRALWRPPQEKDYYVGLTYVEPDNWLYFQQTYAPNDGGPIFYTEQRNPNTGLWELHFWPAPNVYRTVDMYLYVFPPELSDDADIALWPAEFNFALYSAMNLLVVKELRRTKDYTTTEHAFRTDLARAKDMDYRGGSSGPAGGAIRDRNKIQRSRHFVDES
jgi:hypothetical protein